MRASLLANTSEPGDHGYYINTRTREAIVDRWSSELGEVLSTSGTSRIRIRQPWQQPNLDVLIPFRDQIEQVYLEAYVPDVSALGQLGRLHTLSIHQGVDQIDFSRLQLLHTLRLRGKAASFGNLRECRSLRSLSLGGCGLVDVKPLEGLRGLVDLEIVETPLLSLAGLHELHALERLVLSQVPLESIAGVEEARRLSTLVLTSVRELRSVAPLEGLRTLHTLTIDGSKRIVDIAGLGKLESVHELRLCGVPLPDVEFLSHLNRLRVLALESVGTIPSLQFLRGLNQLEGLALTGSTFVVDGDMSVLVELPALKRVQYTERKHYRPLREQIRSALGARHHSVGPD